MTRAPYMPSKLAQLAAWAANVDGNLSTYAAAIGIGTVALASIANANTAFQTAYSVSTAPSSRTPDTVQATKDAALAYKQLIRPIIQQAKRDPDYNDVTAAALGWPLITNTRTPVISIDYAPEMIITNNTQKQCTVSMNDPTRPLSRAKPTGVIGYEVQIASKAAGASAFTEFGSFQTSTRPTDTFDFGDYNTGTQIKLRVRYLLRRGPVGPWSSEIETAVAL